jgi:mismatch-specific thymine-DNA glycosylase
MTSITASRAFQLSAGQRDGAQEMRANEVLPDIIQPDLAVVFVGESVGAKSALAGHYYADPRNSFWRDLHASGVTPRLLSPEDDGELPRYGIGLTDVLKRLANEDLKKGVKVTDETLVEARTALREKICRARPLAVCFLGHGSARLFFGWPKRASRKWGHQEDLEMEGTAVWLMPSTSGTASGSAETRLRVLGELRGQVVGPWARAKQWSGGGTP